MGSLVCAIASFLDAKAHNGRWLVRIEDLDPPREQPGADQLILESLKAHALSWDGTVRYQSTRLEVYERALCELKKKGLIYRCACTRKRVAALQGPYDRRCIDNPPAANANCALRFNMQRAIDLGLTEDACTFDDDICGPVRFSLTQDVGDFIVKRKDGLFAYHLAVVVDDIDQNISHVVRGDDLLDSTPPQLALYAAFGAKPPQFAHIPVLNGADGCKLSKQTGAPPLDNQQVAENMKTALAYLKLAPDQPDNVQDIKHLLERALDTYAPTSSK